MGFLRHKIKMFCNFNCGLIIVNLVMMTILVIHIFVRQNKIYPIVKSLETENNDKHKRLSPKRTTSNLTLNIATNLNELENYLILQTLSKIANRPCFNPVHVYNKVFCSYRDLNITKKCRFISIGKESKLYYTNSPYINYNCRHVVFRKILDMFDTRFQLNESNSQFPDAIMDTVVSGLGKLKIVPESSSKPGRGVNVIHINHDKYGLLVLNILTQTGNMMKFDQVIVKVRQINLVSIIRVVICMIKSQFFIHSYMSTYKEKSSPKNSFHQFTFIKPTDLH